MSAELVNLRRARKAKARLGAEAEAKENRQKFGTAKAVRLRNAAIRAQDERRLEGHRLAGSDADSADER